MADLKIKILEIMKKLLIADIATITKQLQQLEAHYFIPSNINERKVARESDNLVKDEYLEVEYRSQQHNHKITDENFKGAKKFYIYKEDLELFIGETILKQHNFFLHTHKAELLEISPPYCSALPLYRKNIFSIELDSARLGNQSYFINFSLENRKEINILICRSSKRFVEYVQANTEDTGLYDELQLRTTNYENLFILAVPFKTISRINPPESSGQFIITINKQGICISDLDGSNPTKYIDGIPPNFDNENTILDQEIDNDFFTLSPATTHHFRNRDAIICVKDFQIKLFLN